MVALDSQPVIRATQLSRVFSNVLAVDQLSLDVFPQEVFGLVGPDGAGKTTTLRMLCGLLDPSAGQVQVAGLDVKAQPQLVRDQIGYMAQRFGLYPDLTVEENMHFYADLFELPPALKIPLQEELLDMTRMAPFRTRLAGALSGGMKQKLALMCTLLHRPQILLLDEPTNGVDPVSRRDFWTILHRLVQQGLTVLVSTAYLDEAERCHRVGLMHKGELIECDTPGNLIAAQKGAYFEVQGPGLSSLLGLLRHQPQVLSAETAGSRLRLHLRSFESLGALRRLAGPSVSFAPVQPSLEDVFIARIGQQSRRIL